MKTEFKVPEFPWYGPLEGIDWSNWPVWVICSIIAVAIIVGLGCLLNKILD